jgi:succinate dehydrogenase/fumarate reductase-like Fe-S protein
LGRLGADTGDELQEAPRPARCTLCGACEDKCPNSLKIRDRIEELKQMSA